MTGIEGALFKKNEIHLYNIKKRLVALIPATPEQFAFKKKMWSK